MQAVIAKIGNNVRAVRRSRFMTQAQLAQEAGIDRDTLGRIERDEVEPRLSTIVKLAGALGVNPRELAPEP
jgi:transcriptional regulator with XRE-family HTH domain